MTDEEMAEEYAEEYVMREDTITENDRVPFDNGYGFQTVEFEKEVKKGYKDGYLAGAEPRENQIADIKANCDLAIEGRDIKIKELEEENNKLLDVINNQDVKIADLEQKIEKMKCCANCSKFRLLCTTSHFTNGICSAWEVK